MSSLLCGENVLVTSTGIQRKLSGEKGKICGSYTSYYQPWVQDLNEHAWLNVWVVHGSGHLWPQSNNSKCVFCSACVCVCVRTIKRFCTAMLTCKLWFQLGPSYVRHTVDALRAMTHGHRGGISGVGKPSILTYIKRFFGITFFPFSLINAPHLLLQTKVSVTTLVKFLRVLRRRIPGRLLPTLGLQFFYVKCSDSHESPYIVTLQHCQGAICMIYLVSMTPTPRTLVENFGCGFTSNAGERCYPNHKRAMIENDVGYSPMVVSPNDSTDVCTQLCTKGGSIVGRSKSRNSPLLGHLACVSSQRCASCLQNWFAGICVFSNVCVFLHVSPRLHAQYIYDESFFHERWLGPPGVSCLPWVGLQVAFHLGLGSHNPSLMLPQALEEFWNAQRGTQWFRDHPVLSQAESGQQHWFVSLCCQFIWIFVCGLRMLIYLQLYRYNGMGMMRILIDVEAFAAAPYPVHFHLRVHPGTTES